MSVNTSLSGFQWKHEPVFFRSGGFLFQAALVSALFKVQIVPVAIPADGGVKKFRSILGGAGAKAV